MRLVIFDVDGTLTQTMKLMRNALCVRSQRCVASAMLTLTGLATSTRLIPVSSTRFTSPAQDGLLRQVRFRCFVSTSQVCLHRFYPKLLLQQSPERLYCFRSWLIAQSIGLPLLLARGVTRRVSK